MNVHHALWHIIERSTGGGTVYHKILKLICKESHGFDKGGLYKSIQESTLRVCNRKLLCVRHLEGSQNWQLHLPAEQESPVHRFGSDCWFSRVNDAVQQQPSSCLGCRTKQQNLFGYISCMPLSSFSGIYGGVRVFSGEICELGR